MKELSILIPTYNDCCLQLVTDLQRQAQDAHLHYEILVADDGSTLTEVVNTNRGINQLAGCRYVERPVNAGRAAIRNFLAREASLSWLLFIDSDMVVRREDFLRRYAEDVTNGNTDSAPYIVYGGVTIGPLQPGNLRSMYEVSCQHEHTVERRQQSPYLDFHTANFLIPRELMLAHPFDERFRHYGYEDVFFGKQMQQAGIPIRHIDNPLSFEVFEPNADFVSKTEEGLRTLYTFRQELQQHSRLLALTRRYSRLLPLVRIIYRLTGTLLRRNLTGQHPRLTFFSLYRLGYFATLTSSAD